MARINIEDSIYQDEGFLKLVIAMGGKYPALGALVSAWSLAQQWFLKSPNRTIPVAEWSKFEARDLLISCGLAQTTESGIYIRGSKEQFSWLLTCAEKGRVGGIASGKTRREKIGKNPKGTRRVPKGSEASSSFLSSHSSFSISDSGSSSNTGTGELFPGGSASQPPPVVKSEGRTIPVWESYSAAYQLRYGTTPVRNAKVNGQLSQLLNRLGADAVRVAGFFVTHNDSMYVRAMHPVDLLLRDAEKLHTEWVTGKRTSAAKARDVERMDNNASNLFDAAVGLGLIPGATG